MKTNLCGSSIATVVSKHLNSDLNRKFSKKPLHFLFDSGYESSFINYKWNKLGNNTNLVSHTLWITCKGTTCTKRKCNLNFKLDEFLTSREVEWNLHVDEIEMSKDSLGFDMIIGQDILCELGLIINCGKVG